jgi:hypothetical protein
MSASRLAGSDFRPHVILLFILSYPAHPAADLAIILDEFDGAQEFSGMAGFSYQVRKSH